MLDLFSLFSFEHNSLTYLVGILKNKINKIGERSIGSLILQKFVTRKSRHELAPIKQLQPVEWKRSNNKLSYFLQSNSLLYYLLTLAIVVVAVLHYTRRWPTMLRFLTPSQQLLSCRLIQWMSYWWRGKYYTIIYVVYVIYVVLTKCAGVSTSHQHCCFCPSNNYIHRTILRHHRMTLQH